MTTSLPTVTRPRRDGWTPEVQLKFLHELALTGSPALAAAAAGRSLQSAYKLRARAGATLFREGWATAIAMCMEQVRSHAVQRAFNGHTAPILKHGRKIGERHVFTDKMLVSLIRFYDAPAYLADRARAGRAEDIALVPPKPDDLFAQAEAILAEIKRMNVAQSADIVQDTI